MESSKLEKKIQDWAANLGFTLPNGSAPPENHFALLASTPHRRQLWEALVELIQPRKKVEHARKQILVAKIQERKKYSTNSTLKQITDRFDLWHKQQAYEVDVKEKRNVVIKLERTIMTKVSDSLFEICKLSELEKLLEEVMEKSVVLKLLMERKKKIMEDFNVGLLKVQLNSGDFNKSDLEENLEWIDKLLNAEKCQCLLSDCHNCELLAAVEDYYESGVTQQQLWEKVIKHKGVLLDRFSAFLVDLHSSKKSILCEKEREIEKKLNSWMTKLKQKTTEKSVQTVINSTKGKLLDAEVEKLEESVSEIVCREPREASFVSSETNEGEKTMKNFKNYLRMLEVEKYREFLKEELQRKEEAVGKRKKKNSKDGEEGLRLALHTFECIAEDINSFKSEEVEVKKEIFKQQGKVESLSRCLREEMEGKSRIVEETADKLKSASEKQVDLLLETPVDVFRTVENSSGKVPSEIESASQYLNNYGGEFKQFFSAMLIPPAGNLKEILSVIEKRKKVLGDIKKIASEREKLVAMEMKIQQQLSSIKYDTRLCEKNFKESDGTLSNILCKTHELVVEVEFIEKILNNWVEQPYRAMIKETVWGKGLKESEEKHAKAKNE